MGWSTVVLVLVLSVVIAALLFVLIMAGIGQALEEECQEPAEGYQPNPADGSLPPLVRDGKVHTVTVDPEGLPSAVCSCGWEWETLMVEQLTAVIGEHLEKAGYV